jgi:hypothetical protein
MKKQNKNAVCFPHPFWAGGFCIPLIPVMQSADCTKVNSSIENYKVNFIAAKLSTLPFRALVHAQADRQKGGKHHLRFHPELLVCYSPSIRTRSLLQPLDSFRQGKKNNRDKL